VVRQLGLFVGPIHSQLVQIWLSMKAHIFERACPLYQDGALTPIFEGDMPHKKKTPNVCPVNGTIA
jgi:hypothetical protein